MEIYIVIIDERKDGVDYSGKNLPGGRADVAAINEAHCTVKITKDGVFVEAPGYGDANFKIITVQAEKDVSLANADEHKQKREGNMDSKYAIDPIQAMKNNYDQPE